MAAWQQLTTRAIREHTGALPTSPIRSVRLSHGISHRKHRSRVRVASRSLWLQAVKFAIPSPCHCSNAGTGCQANNETQEHLSRMISLFTGQALEPWISVMPTADFLVACPTCGFWPMSASGTLRQWRYPSEMTFRCGKCRHQQTVKLGSRSGGKQEHPSPPAQPTYVWEKQKTAAH